MASPSQSDMADDNDQFPLPGFRFHPTDEELVDFYLRRKVHNEPLAVELIKQIDIYKYSPWDLPHASNAVGGSKEWYCFCKRERKYKNSVRPNRVTGLGFWKATGIDKPIYAHGSGSGPSPGCIIGLKKTLVYYRGSAGKGTKTEWMMNEFRLPSSSTSTSNHPLLQEAEIWTLCRIFKRSTCNRKTINIQNWRDAKNQAMENMNIRMITKNVGIDRHFDDNDNRSHINFDHNNSNFISFNNENKAQDSDQIQVLHDGLSITNFCRPAEPLPLVDPNVSASSPSFSDFDKNATGLFGYEKWEEIKSILESDS